MMTPFRLPNVSTIVFFLNPTDEQEVFNMFLGLKNSKSSDINEIQIKPVKFVMDIIAPCLVHIYNLSLSSGHFPVSMKLAKVAVIYKGGNKHIISNYRPISVLPVFSKVLEKIIFTRLDNVFAKHCVFTDSQFGFRKGRSTEAALLFQKEIILQNIERRLITLGIFIDFSKAFDVLNHKILLQKLNRYGVRGTPLALLESYLNNRKQCVVIDGQCSSFRNIRTGVPQGSILGPLLFNVYINDIVNIDDEAQFIIYADDTSLFLSGEEADVLVCKANSILSKFFMWSETNGLKVNTTKTKAILFRSTNKPVSINNTINLGTSSIELVNQHKTLGVIFFRAHDVG